MDEPTNHLDRRSREKLYDFITSCRITLLVVSHDRTLLNLLASIAELSVGGITLYGGNYDFYKGQKEQEQASMQEKLEAKEKELRRVRKTAREVAERKQKHESRGEKQSVRKGIPRIMMGGLKENAEKSASKLKEVHEDKMENLANELKQMRSSLPDLQGMKLDFSASGLHEGKILVTAKEINFGYAEAGDLWPSPMSFQIKSGERWLIQGDNGSGKTTLLKLITGQLPPRSGSLIRADFSSIYIDQEYSIERPDGVRASASLQRASFPRARDQDLAKPFPLPARHVGEELREAERRRENEVGFLLPDDQQPDSGPVYPR